MKYDYNQLNALQLALALKLDLVFEKLEVDLVPSGSCYKGVCPIHGGDNHTALNLYEGGDSIPIHWVCNTHKCHKLFKETILGFIRGVLSNKRNGWTDDKGQMVTFRETLNWCENLLGKKVSEIKVTESDLKKTKFIGLANIISPSLPTSSTSLISRQTIRKRLDIPADYFVKRGWSKEILDKYDVGLCTDKTKPLYNRIVVPVFDEKYNGVLGVVSRANAEKCPHCDTFHHKDRICPGDSERGLFPKWKNDVDSGRVLYNLWFAKKAIKESRTAILVEGAGEVWRLEEAGINNAVAMLTNTLSEQQQILLELSGALRIIVGTNNDAAGHEGYEEIKKKLRGFMVSRIMPPQNDFGELPVSEVKILFKEFLK